MGLPERQTVGVATSDDAHRAAHRRAYDIFEGLQSDQREAALADLPAAALEAQSQGWSDVALVLDAAAVVDVVTHPGAGHAAAGPISGTIGEAADELVARAQELGSSALQGLAFGLRAVVSVNADDKAGAVLDAARATALLDVEDESPLDRCVGYVVAAAAFNTLRLWELVDDLYGRALRFGPAARETRQTAAIVVNRVLTRLEWALAAVEYGDVESGDVQLAQSRPHGRESMPPQRGGAALADRLLDSMLEAVPAALAEELPTLWRLNVLACADVASLLRGLDVDQTLGRVDEHRRLLADAGDLEVLPMLEAATAVALWRCGRRDAAVEAASRLGPAASATSGAETFPLWARAHVLAAAEPSAATQAQLDHARAVVRLVWESRRTVLAAARAQILSEARKHEHEALTHAVNTDALTGLFNRRRFELWLQQSVGKPRVSTALLLIDVDDFKEVNDRFGHDCGDEVLRTLASLMASSVRADDVAIRHGGDEFALILEGDDLLPAAVRERAEKLSAAVSGASWADIAPGLKVSVTIGAALSVGRDSDDVRPVTLYKRADAALYQAKRSGSRIALSEL